MGKAGSADGERSDLKWGWPMGASCALACHAESERQSCASWTEGKSEVKHVDNEWAFGLSDEEQRQGNLWPKSRYSSVSISTTIKC